MHHWHIHPDTDALANAAAAFVAERIQAVLAERDSCHIALPGGSTPAACLRLLAEHDLPWQRIHWYLGDERCVPRGDEQRNDRMIEAVLWSRIAAPEENCHRIRAELGPRDGASDYAELIQQAGKLDIVLLGMGEDGHTASLFPGNTALEHIEAAVPVSDAPKPPPERVSLSIGTLQAASVRVLLTAGASKRAALQQVKAGEPLPVNQLGELEIFCDEAAAGD
jgi:6-phosphogluconolactonase